MDRRAFLSARSGSSLAAPLAPEAQEAGKVWRVSLIVTTPANHRAFLEPLVAVWALLVLFLVVSFVGAQERSVEIVEGKTTKAEIRALYGPPAYENERELIYYSSELSPPYPAWLRELLRYRPQSIVIFRFDERGVFMGHSFTGWPSP
jgi:hypothetical protein